MVGRRNVSRLLLFISLMIIIQVTCCRPRLRHSHKKFWCSKCPPGWGVVQKCTDTMDTLCEPCSIGRYSPHHSYHNPCWMCSRCGPGLYEAHNCHPGADTVCDSCQRTGVTDNKDFEFKCAVKENPDRNITLHVENG